MLHPEGIDPEGPGEAVVFVHGNISSALFWQQPMLALAETGRRPLAVDLRGYGGTDPQPIDARRGMRDWAEDLAALVDTLGLDRVHLVGWSMGAGVVLQYLLDEPGTGGLGRAGGAGGALRLRRDGRAGGTPVHADGTGSGGGAANPDFVAALAAGDTTADSPTSPRSILRAFYVAPGSLPLDPHLEDVFVDSMNSTRIGDDHYPGDAGTVEAWPGCAPGERGVLNTMAPSVFDVSGIADLAVKPPILWLRGDADQIVSDGSVFDLALLGSIGAVPGLAGRRCVPAAADGHPDPHGARQVRGVRRRLPRGGAARRRALAHVERPQEFVVALLEHLDVPRRATRQPLT